LLRRGFKSQSEKRSISLRRQLGLADVAPLEARAVAVHMGVKIWSASDVPKMDPAALGLLTRDGAGWSGITLRVGDRFLVVYNPAQSPRRINSVLMHELAHVILGHELTDAHTSSGGSLVPTNYDTDQEDEANWLGGALLLPRGALLWMRARGLTDDEATQHFIVSAEMLRWRFRMTGVDVQLRRASA
jgi:hypothetical protein